MASSLVALGRSNPRLAGLGAIGIIALSVRLALLLAAGVNAEGNAYEHGEIARNLLAGKGFSVRFLGVEGPTSQQAPLYPLLIAAAGAVLGEQKALLAIEILQCFAGAATAVIVSLLAWAVFPRDRLIGWMAGGIAALFPPHVYMATQVQVVVWATLLVSLLVLLASGAECRRPNRQAMLAGAVAGLLLLVEPILALALPIVGFAYWVRELRTARTAWLAPRPFFHVLLMAGTAALVVTPWLVRNWRVHGEFVFIKSTFGYAFWQGNNEISWGTDKVPKREAEHLRTAHDGTPAGINRALWAARHETIYIDDLLLQPGGYREFQGLSEPQRSRLLARRAWRGIEQDPMRYARLCLRRLRYFLLFDETNPKAANRLYRITTVTWLVLAALGVLVSRHAWRRLWPTYAIVAVVTLFHSLTITSARFRMPLEPLTFVWIAAGITPLATRLVGRLAVLVAPIRPALFDASGRPPRPSTRGSVVPPPHIAARSPRSASPAKSLAPTDGD